MTPNFSAADYYRVRLYPPSAVWYMAICQAADAAYKDLLERAYPLCSFYKVVSFT